MSSGEEGFPAAFACGKEGSGTEEGFPASFCRGPCVPCGDWPPKCDRACSAAERHTVQRRVYDFTQAIALQGKVPNAEAAKVFAAFFADGGVLGSAQGNVIGAQKVGQAWLAYLEESAYTDYTLKDIQFNWDCKTRTAFVQQEMSATLTKPQAFVPGSTQEEQAGFSFSRNVFSILRYDCSWHLVYFRAFFDPVQTAIVSPKETGRVEIEAELGGCCPSRIEPGTPADRAKAASVVDALVFAVNLSSSDPRLSARLFAQLFADKGIWAYTTGFTQGRWEIQANYLSGLLGGGETDQMYVARQLNWDYKTRSLGVQLGWEATLTEPRPFVPGSTELEPAGFTYQQDDLVYFHFDPEWKLTYFRQVYNSTQTEWTYTTNYPPVCVLEGSLI